MANKTEAQMNAPLAPRALAWPLSWSLSERWFVGLTIAFVLVVTSMPYVYGYLSTPPGKQYMGIMLDVPDHAQYFSWMRELSTANLASNKMTPEPNRPVFFNLLWWGLGRLNLVLGLGYAGMFQLLRVVAIILFLLLAYRMCKWFLKDRLMSQAAFLVIAFTSGLGWLLVALKYITRGDLLLPLDVYVAEGNTFLGMLGYPHFIAALLYVFVFDLILRGQAKGQIRYAVGAGLVALFLGWQHTYDLVSVYGVLAAYGLLLILRDRRLPWYVIKSGLIVGALSCWPAIYSVMLTSLDPVWKGVLAQFSNAGVFTPNPLQLPILLGIPFLLAIYTVIRDNPLKLKGVPDNDLFILGWFLVSFVLVYLPVDYQIHLLNGWQVPMAILATGGLFRYILPLVEKKLHSRPALQKRKLNDPEFLRRALAGLLVLVILPTNLYLWAWRFVDLSRHDYPYYLYQDEISAMNWLDTNVKPDDVVFSSLTTGQYIPAMTGAHAYLAHWAETLDFFHKSDVVNEFYSTSSSTAQREQILKAGKVNYVFFGPAERQIGDISLSSIPDLVPVFTSGLVSVYRVQN